MKNLVEEALEKLKISTNQLAKLLKKHPTTVGKWRKDLRGIPEDIQLKIRKLMSNGENIQPSPRRKYKLRKKIKIEKIDEAPPKSAGKALTAVVLSGETSEVLAALSKLNLGS